MVCGRIENTRAESITFTRNMRDVLKQDWISIHYDENVVTDCTSAIIVPERAIREAGYIKTLTANADAHSKHEFQAMAQTAYYQYQDEELAASQVSKTLSLEWKGEDETLAAGLVIYRDAVGEFHILAHTGQNVKKLLEAANRFCTRWVRLDI